MRIDHHPDAQLISDYVIANLSPGVSLAVAAHLSLCPVCAMAAGAVLGAGAPQDRSSSSFRPRAAQAEAPAVGEPVPLTCAESWRPIRRGVEGALAPRVSGLGECVYLLRAAPRADIGAASVRTAFVLLVTEGAVLVDARRLSVGDLLQFETPPRSVLADPTAGASLLIVAEEAPLRLRGRRA